MNKITLDTGTESIEKSRRFLKETLEKGKCPAEDIEIVCKSAEEIMSGIAWVSGSGGSVIISVDITPSGLCVQYMHAGPIFNPCPSSEKGYTRHVMDEVSFEFKYGRNVLTVFKKVKS